MYVFLSIKINQYLSPQADNTPALQVTKGLKKQETRLFAFYSKYRPFATLVLDMCLVTLLKILQSLH